MKANIQRWGNSLALRIPKPLAAEIGLKKNSPVELLFLEGKLVIAPIVKPAPSLEHLMKMVNAKNLHNEVDTGPAMGGEVW